MAPSAKNPNVLSRAKLAARAQKKKTEIRRSQKRSQDKITRQDARRGARPGLLPTSGPNRALSRKKAKKVERALALALKRKAEAEGSMGIEGLCRSLLVFFPSSVPCFFLSHNLARWTRNIDCT